MSFADNINTMENAERETFRIAIVEDSQTEAETISTSSEIKSIGSGEN